MPADHTDQTPLDGGMATVTRPSTDQLHGQGVVQSHEGRSEDLLQQHLNDSNIEVRRDSGQYTLNDPNYQHRGPGGGYSTLNDPNYQHRGPDGVPRPVEALRDHTAVRFMTRVSLPHRAANSNEMEEPIDDTPLPLSEGPSV